MSRTAAELGKQGAECGKISRFFLLKWVWVMNMKRFMKQLGLALLMGAVMPMTGVYLAAGMLGEPMMPPQIPSGTAVTTEEEANALSIDVVGEKGTVRMDMDEYLVGVVLAEMPASFQPEALKAQAVVARTYALRRASTGNKHGAGAVCTSASCCQGYILPADYLAEGGTEAEVEKVKSAVEAVSGQVLTYEGALIAATFFSCSGGSTEDAVAVWGSDVPYLQAVPSPGEEGAAHYTDQVSFTRQELEEKLGVTLTGDAAWWFGNFTYTDGDGVDTVTIGGVEFTGVEVRKLLDLRSTSFSVTASEDAVTIVTHGYGHRVGMSQYGAEAMALTGSTFEQILTHYYQGTTLCTWND